ncbi:MAG TPA: helix-turn-helix domain-containing protein [Clostridiaceae bacterium]|nr:helix-turn-helix domain-containing protein [Clostridiaceae bacterium]
MTLLERGLKPSSQRIFLTPTLDTVEHLYYITWCGHYYCDNNYRIERDYFPDTLLCYIVAGQMNFRMGNYAAVARTGDAVLINCNDPHQYHPIEQAEFLYYHINGQNVHAHVDWLIAENGGIIFNNTFNSKVAAQMEGQIDLLVSGVYAEPIGISQNIYNCLSYLAVRHTQPLLLQGNSMAANAIRYMRKNIEKPISIQDIARSVNLSPYYFSRKFKQEIGDTPANFLIRLRINKAAELLRTTDSTVEDIAFSLGYENPSSFAQLFTRRTGMTPLQFRRIVI